MCVLDVLVNVIVMFSFFFMKKGVIFLKFFCFDDMLIV